MSINTYIIVFDITIVFVMKERKKHVKFFVNFIKNRKKIYQNRSSYDIIVMLSRNESTFCAKKFNTF